MVRKYELDEPLSPLDLLSAAQHRAHQKIGPAPLYRPTPRGIRFWLLRCTLAIAFAALSFLAWRSAIEPIQASAPNVDAAPEDIAPLLRIV